MRVHHVLPLALLCVLACSRLPAPAPESSAIADAAPPAVGIDVGQTPPDFQATAINGATFRLSERIGESPVVVVLFRGSW